MNPVAVRFWEKMGELYGAAWTNKWGAVPNDSWVTLLSSVDTKLIAEGLKHCATEQDTPPSLPTFAKILKALKPRRYDAEQKSISRELTEEEKKAAHAVLSRAKKGVAASATRSMVLPGESATQTNEKMAEAMMAGKTKEQFIVSRFIANGWTREKEAAFAAHLQVIGGYRRFGSTYENADWGGAA